MEIVSAIVGPVVNALTIHITQKLRNLTSFAEHVSRMKNRMKVLEGQRADNEKKMRRNSESNLEIPTRVSRWSEEVENVKKDVDNITSNNIGCFNVKKKYLAGKTALRVTVEIERLIKESSDIIWNDAQIPLGRVDSKRLTSTSGGNTQIGYESRDKIFNDALKLLQNDDKTRVIALCGMGGVGKTTLMKKLKEAAIDNKMFNWIPEVVIGKTPNLLAIQKAIAEHIRQPLTGSDETVMATHLSKSFEVISEHKEKILVILDDVWEKIKLEDIGLASPLPNGVKLLLTSRDVQVCRQIAVDVDVDSILEVVEVDVLKEDEARDLFCRVAGISAEHDRDLYQTGCDIVKKCGCLPLAIKLIAATLNSQKKRSVWNHTLSCLKKNELEEIEKKVQEIVEISYKMLRRDKDRAIFLLCGLFPEDSNILIEDLTRFAWGLKLLNKVDTMEEARCSTESSVENLKNAYLLMGGDSGYSDCVKLHDLVLAFVVGTVSKGGEEGCWIVHSDDFFKSREDLYMSQSCKRISLACKGMSDQFLSEFKFPNLSLLKLMQGDESLRFPQEFYVGMEKLQVIAFEELECPVVPTSFQGSTNLRTLCLDACSLMFDITCIGDLLNLEVLSLAYSGITVLPSTFGNLKKLRLLDATGCYNLVIDDGVLKNMVKLEELYILGEMPCCFTDNNCNELAERLKHLSALHFEYKGNIAHLKNMSFEKLNKFKISVGCYYSEVGWLHRSLDGTRSYQNSLKLITNREELLTSKISELFKMTGALYLQVSDMNTLENVDVKSPPRNSSFYNLRSLVVSKCAELKYLFTSSVATNLSKLEYLEISRCPIMEAVIDTENDGSDIIKFSNLKSLWLAELPNLLYFSYNVNVIELPRLVELQLKGLHSLTSIYPSSASSSVSSNISRMQSFFHEEDALPKLEKLFVSDMKNLKEIWSHKLCLLRELTVEGCGSIKALFNMDFRETEYLSSSLRSIKVTRCEKLLKLFSRNPFPFLSNLQELSVRVCGSIQVLFDTDLGCAGKVEEKVCSSSLRSIDVLECNSLVNLLPRNPMPLFNHLEELKVYQCPSIELIFDIDMGCVGETDKVSSSRLRSIDLQGLQKLREVWRIKDGGNNLIHGFEAVEIMHIESCERFENLITPATATIEMRALKEVKIRNYGRDSVRSYECDQDQEINVISKVVFPSSYLLHTFHHLHNLVLRDYKGVDVVFEIMSPSSRDLAHDETQQPLIILPYLDGLGLFNLERMSHVWKCNWNELLNFQKPQSQSSFQNLTTIVMCKCNSIKYLFSPLMAKLFSNLKKIYILSCDGIEEVVSNRDDKDASEEVVSHTNTTFFPHLDILKLERLRNFTCIGGDANGISTDIHDQLKSSQASWSWSLCQYAREISIEDCDALSSVIPWYAVGHMQKLQVLKIINCRSMTEVFETQEANNKSGTDIVKSLPRLEYITMLKLPKLKILKIQGCRLLKHVFIFSILESLAELEELEIKDCEAMEVIVIQETGDQKATSNVVVFPCLKSLALVNLPNVVGFFLGMNEFTWPTLEKVVISECPQITVFTYGQSTTPKLNFINTSLGKHSVECGLNFSVTTTSHQAQFPSYESTSSYRPTTMERLPWSYHNLIEVDVDYNPSGAQTLFSSDKLLQLQNLETVHLRKCEDTEEFYDSETVAEIPNLRQVGLKELPSLKYLWKSKQGTVLKFPNLTRLSIERCDSLGYVFTYSMVGSILQLQELHISFCNSMKVIVKGEEECDAIVKKATVVFPCLKSLKLGYLHSLEGFCLGNEAFEFPSLDTLKIDTCRKMTVFTKGDLSAPKLYAINGRRGRRYNIHNRLNSVYKNFIK